MPVLARPQLAEAGYEGVFQQKKRDRLRFEKVKRSQGSFAVLIFNMPSTINMDGFKQLGSLFS